MSLLQLIDLIGGLPGAAPIQVEFAAPRQGDIVRSVANVSLLRATGWEPTSSLEEGLRQTLESG